MSAGRNPRAGALACTCFALTALCSSPPARADETPGPMVAGTAETVVQTVTDNTAGEVALDHAVTTRLSGVLMNSLPLGRDFMSLATLAPGVVAGSIEGSSILENRFLFDGIDATNVGFGALGAYSTAYGSFGPGLNQEFLEAVDVRTAGVSADYGGFMGGVVEATTRRGSNEFHGSLFANDSPQALQAAAAQIQGAPIFDGSPSEDFGVTLGGPILRNRLFFFAGVNPQISDTILTVPAGFALASLGAQTQRRTQTSYAGSLTWNIDPHNIVDLSILGDQGGSSLGWQTPSDLLDQTQIGFSSLAFTTGVQSLRYQGDFGATSAEITAGRSTSSFAQILPAASNLDQFADERNPNAPIFGGGIGLFQAGLYGENDQGRLTVRERFDLGGRHELRGGAGYQQITWDATDAYSGAPGGTFTNDGILYTYRTGVSYEILTANNGTPVYRVERAEYSNPDKKTGGSDFDLFLDDAYRPIPGLRIDVGLRADQQTISGNLESYTFKMADGLQPRIGAAWDFTGNGRSRLFASYGRYQQQFPNDIAARAMSGELEAVQIDYFSANFVAANQIPQGTDPVADASGAHDTNHSIVQSVTTVPVASGTKADHVDEYVLGAEYQVFAEAIAGLRVIHRDLGSIVEDYQTTPAETVVAGNPFSPFKIGNPGASLNGSCPPAYPNCWANAVRQYDALEVTFRKELGEQWLMIASYRLSRLWGNYDGLFQTAGGLPTPGLSSQFDFPNNTPLMQGQAERGLLDTDQTHVLRVASSYLAPIGLAVGGVVTWTSGTPITGYNAHPIYQDPGEIPAGARGSYGRTPAILQFDLHVGYALPLPMGGASAQATVDIFNLLDNRSATAVDQDLQQSGGVPSADFNKPTAYNPPRNARLGLKLQF